VDTHSPLERASMYSRTRALTRLRAEVVATNATIVSPHFVGAWAVAS
jgi:hypothetical protein